MKYFLVAGEASGDLHASRLMKSLLETDPGAEFRYMGGEQMEAVAPGLMQHYKETSFMMLDVLFHLRKIFANMRRVKEEIVQWQPDVVIPVDYPGFNMRISRFASGSGIRVFYYISPKVWAWKKNRVKKLKRYTDRLFCILPFEPDWFAGRGMEVEYFGNPLVDGVGEFLENFEGKESFLKAHGLDDRPLVAVLAGSRIKEIQGVLPAMVRVAEQHPGFQFVVAGAPSVSEDIYTPCLEKSNVKIVHGATYGLLASSHAAMVTSGTATLETALFRVPQVVLYKTSALAFRIARGLVKIRFISLVNLILGRALVKEVIQSDLFGESREELSRILRDEVYYRQMVAGYEEMAAGLGERGVSGRIAHRMLELLKSGDK